MTAQRPTLATLAMNKVPKPTKADAQRIVKELDNAIANGKDLSQYRDHLAMLYKHFMPPVPKKARTDFEWLASACDPNDARVYCRYVYATESRIMATDGKRIHMIDNADNLAPGYYLPNGDPVECDAQYPAIDRIIPAKRNRRAINITPECVEIREVMDHKNRLCWAYVFHGMDGDAVGFQTRFVEQALSLTRKDLSGTYEVYIGHRMETMLIEYNNRLALVMPIKLD